MRHSQSIVKIWYIILLFPNFYPLLRVPKSTRYNNIHILTSKSLLSELNFIPSWRNTLEHLLVESMVNCTVWFTELTNIITSNPLYHMVVPLLLVLHWKKSQCQARKSTRRQILFHKFRAQGKSQKRMLPQISYDIHCLPITRVAEL